MSKCEQVKMGMNERVRDGINKKIVYSQVNRYILKNKHSSYNINMILYCYGNQIMRARILIEVICGCSSYILNIMFKNDKCSLK